MVRPTRDTLSSLGSSAMLRRRSGSDMHRGARAMAMSMPLQSRLLHGFVVSVCLLSTPASCNVARGYWRPACA